MIRLRQCCAMKIAAQIAICKGRPNVSAPAVAYRRVLALSIRSGEPQDHGNLVAKKSKPAFAVCVARGQREYSPREDQGVEKSVPRLVVQTATQWSPVLLEQIHPYSQV